MSQNVPAVWSHAACFVGLFSCFVLVILLPLPGNIIYTSLFIRTSDRMKKKKKIHKQYWKHTKAKQKEHIDTYTHNIVIGRICWLVSSFVYFFIR